MPEGNPPSSFIPHEEELARVRVRPSGLITVIMLFSIALFVSSCILAAYVFLYQQYLETDKTAKVDSLQRAKESFDPSLIADLTRIDTRLRAAGMILGNHIAPSAILRALEQSTITTLGFSSLSFDASNLSAITLKMEGTAGSVNTVALEADIFSRHKMFLTPIFSDINRSQEGVRFRVSSNVNPETINYQRLIGGATAGGSKVPAAPQNPTPPPTTPPAP